MGKTVAVTFVNVPHIVSVVHKTLRNNGKLQNDQGQWCVTCSARALAQGQEDLPSAGCFAPPTGCYLTL